jgi:hypothetical protein
VASQPGARHRTSPPGFGALLLLEGIALLLLEGIALLVCHTEGSARADRR